MSATGRIVLWSASPPFFALSRALAAQTLCAMISQRHSGDLVQGIFVKRRVRGQMNGAVAVVVSRVWKAVAIAVNKCGLARHEEGHAVRRRLDPAKADGRAGAGRAWQIRRLTPFQCFFHGSCFAVMGRKKYEIA